MQRRYRNALCGGYAWGQAHVGQHNVLAKHALPRVHPLAVRWLGNHTMLPLECFICQCMVVILTLLAVVVHSTLGGVVRWFARLVYCGSRVAVLPRD